MCWPTFLARSILSGWADRDEQCVPVEMAENVGSALAAHVTYSTSKEGFQSVVMAALRYVSELARTSIPSSLFQTFLRPRPIRTASFRLRYACAVTAPLRSCSCAASPPGCTWDCTLAPVRGIACSVQGWSGPPESFPFASWPRGLDS